jgi:hypothetical protein
MSADMEGLLKARVKKPGSVAAPRIQSMRAPKASLKPKRPAALVSRKMFKIGITEISEWGEKLRRQAYG